MNYKSLISSSVMITLLLTAPLASAQTAEDLKTQTLQICQAQAAQLSGEQKEQYLSICNCTVENTDYDQVLKDSLAGNVTKVQENATKVAQECQKKLEKS